MTIGPCRLAFTVADVACCRLIRWWICTCVSEPMAYRDGGTSLLIPGACRLR